MKLCRSFFDLAWVPIIALLFYLEKNNFILLLMIKGTTSLLGVIGNPVSHSSSPAMQNAAILESGLDYVYVPLPVNHATDLEQVLKALPLMGFKGVNVTVPYKEIVIPYLDELRGLAESIGAVNTIICHDGKLIGYNTDAEGFIVALQQEGSISVAGKKASAGWRSRRRS